MSLSLIASHAAPGSIDTSLLIVILGADPVLTPSLMTIDNALGGSLSRTLTRRDFRGARDESLLLVGAETGIRRVLLVGRGAGVATRGAARRAAATGARQAKKLGVADLHAFLEDASVTAIEGLVSGLSAGSWEYTELKAPIPAAEQRASLTMGTVLLPDTDEARKAFDFGVALSEGQAIAKRLGMMPGNLCTPDMFAQVGREIGARHEMKVLVMGREEMLHEGMGSFMAVAQGTPQEPRLVAIEYRGAGAFDDPIVLMGKGVCFDTGGISIKPAPEMEWMKYDMSGAGGVLGAMETIARLKLKINVVGIIGAVTNMPSGTAVNPGDVVRAMNGKTIEIINTDAEGRLVLADLMVFAKRFRPAIVIDAATLTGAIVIGLGNTAMGIFGPDAATVEEVRVAGERAAEPGWPMPVWDDYKEQIRSDVADMKNTGGRAAGSITAAVFIKEFVDGFPWVHLDIAGTAYTQTDLGWLPRGPTGVPVGTFVEFVRGRAG
ncbi:MAG: leucyl aminopeptidase [Gemmatimonadaceae bacterium]